MSATRPLIWRWGQIEGMSLPSGYAAQPWFEDYWAGLVSLNTGETVIRTRLQMSLVFGLGSLGGNDVPLPTTTWQGDRIIIGVHCDPTEPELNPPPGVGGDTSDGGWIMQDVLTPSIVNYWTDPVGNNNQEICYKYDSGTAQSFGKRGPVTADTGSVNLVWEFQSFGPWYFQDSTDYQGWFGGWARMGCLVMQAPS